MSNFRKVATRTPPGDNWVFDEDNYNSKLKNYSSMLEVLVAIKKEHNTSLFLIDVKEGSISIESFENKEKEKNILSDLYEEG